LSKFHRNEKKREEYKELSGVGYGFGIRMLFELSLDISVISIIEILMKQHHFIWEKVSLFMSIFCLNALVYAVYFSYHLINNNMVKIQGPDVYPEFHEKWCVLVEDQRVFRHTPLFNVFFVIRRIIFAILIVLPPYFNIPPII